MGRTTVASNGNRGGWITIPFITGALAGLTLAAGGWMNNLIVYLINEFNFESIDAAQVFNVVNGCATLFPIVGAMVADSFLGCFNVVCISSLFSLLGIMLLTLTAVLKTLRPVPCDEQHGAGLCGGPSEAQFAVLYIAITLATVGVGGTRFTLATMGADQLDKPKHQQSFFNWFVFTLYTSSVVSAIVIVYVQDNVSWGLGFGLSLIANLVGLASFLVGGRHYRHVKPEGESPFVGLARVIVAAFRKRRASVGFDAEPYYYFAMESGRAQSFVATPSSFFKWLNKAAMKTDGDVNGDGSIAKPWKLCTVEQVEDLKILIKLFPLWSTGILLSTPLAIQLSLATIQALAMDRHLGSHHFKIPAGSMFVFILLSTCLTIILLDRLLYPLAENLIGRPTTPLQRVGVGHVLCVLSMAVSALVEWRRLKQSAIKPMSMPVLWLAPQLILAGMGEAFHFPGNTALYYREFPDSLKSTATGALAMFIGIAFYLSTAMVGVLRRTTHWLPDNIDQGRIDIVFWLLFGIGLLNFGYYLVCAHLYKYRLDDHLIHSNPGSEVTKNINGD